MPRFSNILAALILGLSYTALAEDIVVTVGGPGVLKFNPESVNANVGDTIIFQFQQKNHTVTQSSLDAPCTPLDGGFDTGFVSVADGVTEGFPQANLLVEDTEPTWVYCRQGNHCQSGMVFAINGGDKFDQFKATATGNTTTTESATQSVVTVTATVTVSGSVATTTYATTAPSSTSTTSTSTDHKVVVGGTAGLVYTPSSITANVGDTITFEFHAKNHTVTASSFAAPCQPLSGSFNSGFMPAAADAATFPTYTIQVNDTKPIWAYCAQANHCSSGMVFAANAPSTGNTFDAFQENAMGNSSDSSTSGDRAASSHVCVTLLVSTLAVIVGALL